MFGRPVMINTEMVPAENLGVKMQSGTRKGLKVPRDCYNSYLIEDTTLDFVDKFRMEKMCCST